MNILSCSDLSKSFKDKVLFDSISFGLNQGDKVGIIGKNGAGKSTLLKIISGIETADSGSVVVNNNTKLMYLDQNSEFDSFDSALEFVMKGNEEINNLIDEHHKYSHKPNLTEKESARFSEINHTLDSLNGWNHELEAKKYLGMLGITDYEVIVHTLSGGQKKRVALAYVLMSRPDLLLLDEPTNHLDADTIQWLQDYLQSMPISLIFVTHDRYFLDAVSESILEINDRKIFTYDGNYEKYLEQKEIFARTQSSTLEHNLSKLRNELAWLQKGAKARRTKQKSRIDWIDELKKSSIKSKDKKIKIELGKTFLGNTIIEAHYIAKSIAGKKLFSNFTYMAKPKDRIGIIGPNGCGKSTLLNLLAGKIQTDDGSFELGASAKVGYFKQEIDDLKDDQTVINSLREIAEFIDVGVGRDRYITAKELLERFLFPPFQHFAYISTLSGGERRRLALLRMFMANPNVILLDEPTNDFDIETLNAIETYFDDFYGVLIIVSHDRAFIDRMVEFVWVFRPDGTIKEYPGNYSYYLEQKEKEESLRRQLASQNQVKTDTRIKDTVKVRKKLSYKEQREFDMLEEEISSLEIELDDHQRMMTNHDGKDYKQIETLSSKIEELQKLIDQKTERWMELSESIG
ncbi:MAG: ABC-F family ATP-binding cassette domain-containing protein [Desulfobulbaceae bacterium]|nr:ABC-F family ATP-binding cassette domain-containing protein [Desulfobulbaceae bacterium]